ncbi:MAG TPA: glycosyltransferase family 2 protein [Fimbriimonadaceae bacterium]|nr:glycosyltransferase family 2 protein [Fimbriimonadaceae bacterium]
MKSSSSPDISVVICTCNRADELAKTLSSLAEVRIPEGRLAELILVDNNSKDTTPEVVGSAASQLERFTVKPVAEPKQGLSAARNRGLAEAKGAVIIFTDDDVRLEPDWLEGMSEPILAGKADALAGGVRIAAHLLRPWMAPQHRAWLASTELLDRERPIGMVGANMAFARRVLDHVPTYDEELGAGSSYGFHEEVLFSRQLKKAGFKISPRFDVEVEHHFQEKRLLRSSFLDTAVKKGRSEAYLDYHYDHKSEEGLRKRHRINTVALRLAQLNPFRKSQEGIGLFEMKALIRFHHTREWLSLLGQPRKYEKQGLVKLLQV